MRMIATAFLGLITASMAGAASQPLSMTLTAVESSVNAGSKIGIKLTITNHSDHSISYSDTQWDCDFNVHVLAPSGLEATGTQYKQHLVCLGDGLHVITTNNRRILRTLKPGESREEIKEITELYDMSQPGAYAVSVSRNFPGIGTVKSNDLTINVLPVR